MASRQEVDGTFMTWYYSFLPALGVNRNISREWITLLTKYQGLGLPQMSLEKLAPYNTFNGIGVVPALQGKCYTVSMN
jgi:hypothetical protein